MTTEWPELVIATPYGPAKLTIFSNTDATLHARHERPFCVHRVDYSVRARFRLSGNDWELSELDGMPVGRRGWSLSRGAHNTLDRTLPSIVTKAIADAGGPAVLASAHIAHLTVQIDAHERSITALTEEIDTKQRERSTHEQARAELLAQLALAPAPEPAPRP